MRAVVGSVTSSKAISHSKAAPLLSRFASAGAGAGVRREVAAYLRLVYAASDELVHLHREHRKRSSGVAETGEDRDGKRRKKKKKKKELKETSDGDLTDMEREKEVLDGDEYE